jgi:hypothetical protein
MEKTITVINQLLDENIISAYAIGGAFARPDLEKIFS